MTYKIMKIIERPVYSKRIKPFIGFFEERGFLKKQEDLDLFRFPTKDDDFCALTCVQKGRLVFFREKTEVF